MQIPGHQFTQRLDKRVKIQLSIFTAVAVVAGATMLFGYIKAQSMFGFGNYIVTVKLPQASGLYASGNVTYRGTVVGRVTAVNLTDDGVDAVLSLRSGVPIPSDLDAQVHSVSGVGEQYVALLPRGDDAPPLKNGDVIPIGRTSVPPDINLLLDATNRGLEAIPRDNVKTVIDESYTAVGGLGPDISRLVKGSTQLAIDGRENLSPMTELIDQVKPVLDSQADSADAIKSWAAHLADLTSQLQSNDGSVAGLLEQGGHAADEARQLLDRLQPSLPVLLANLVSVGDVAITYQPSIEQILVLVPATVNWLQGVFMANRDLPPKYAGAYLAFNLNINVPPPCTTGYLPAQQRRSQVFEDRPDLPAGDVYCRIPQDAQNVARGARNFPCMGRPGKRAPTVKICESDEEYVPLNDGNNWKGDPNATLTGQDIPQLPPDVTAPAQREPPIAIAPYDEATGSYMGPDGRTHAQADLAPNTGGKTWQNMVTPPTVN